MTKAVQGWGKMKITWLLDGAFALLDNGPMENFWGILKAERYYLKGKYDTYEELENDIKSYIKFYNSNRLQKRLNSMSPLEYRSHAA